ncbi:MAG: hypothetical protein LBH84_00190 [Prevotellaceae bacterium]|jgi:pantothenate kinase|nr:hypothetical protein [Prevotellaceae bacterium]
MLTNTLLKEGANNPVKKIAIIGGGISGLNDFMYNNLHIRFSQTESGKQAGFQFTFFYPYRVI